MKARLKAAPALSPAGAASRGRNDAPRHGHEPPPPPTRDRGLRTDRRTHTAQPQRGPQPRGSPLEGGTHSNAASSGPGQPKRGTPVAGPAEGAARGEVITPYHSLLTSQATSPGTKGSRPGLALPR